MDVTLLIVLAVTSGLINGWLVADNSVKSPSNNKDIFNQSDQRGINAFPVLYILVTLTLGIAPAIVAFIAKGWLIALGVLILTLIVTATSCSKFMRVISVRLRAKRMEVNRSVNQHTQEVAQQDSTAKNHEYTLAEMSALTADNLDRKFNTTDTSMRKIVADADHAGVQLLLDMAQQDLDDKYARWFDLEAKYALKNDPQCVALMSTVNSCLSHVANNGTPKVFKGMRVFQIFYTLYCSTLDVYNNKPYNRVQAGKSP